MKKLLVMMFAMAFVGVASAATITWQSGVLYTPEKAEGGNSDTKAKGTVSYAYYLISADDYATVNSMTKADDVFALAEGKTAKDSGTTSGTTSKANYKQTDAVVGQTYYMLALYTTTATFDGKDVEFKMWGTASVTSPSTGVAQTSAEMATGNSWKGASTPVPEPTAIALIALGLAAVGLKRKVA